MQLPARSAVTELLDPSTWFPPMGCSGFGLPLLVTGLMMSALALRSLP